MSPPEKWGLSFDITIIFYHASRKYANIRSEKMFEKGIDNRTNDRYNHLINRTDIRCAAYASVKGGAYEQEHEY